MSETTPFLPGVMPESETSDRGFQSILDYIREKSNSQYRKGALFEKVMREYFRIDPLYKSQFSDVWLWKDWAPLKGLDRNDIGIDLVAQEEGGGYCAIQCKCYGTETRIQKPHLDSFIAASAIEWFNTEGAPERFTSRIVVDTGKDWGKNALNTIKNVVPPCRVIRFGDLVNRPIDWPDLSCEDPEQLGRQEPFSLRQHQQEAFHDVVNGFNDSDRGKMIMACGTGKTFTALRIAEDIAGVSGRVLYLVPSIGLFLQAMREWAEQQEIPHSYIGICSDTTAGNTAEDAPIEELEIPVTTDLDTITYALKTTDANAMTVVFCTYHSLPLVEMAQGHGAPAFDIIFCDEAHRTTGVESPDDDTSPFVLVHKDDRIHGKKRLYMTATSRLYTERARARAAHHNKEVYSMDKPEMYGPEFHRLPFSRAIEKGLLSDYKVVVLALYEPGTDAVLQRYVGAGGSNINIADATKIIGCWRVLQRPEGKSRASDNIKPLTRVIAFNNTIANSKRLVKHWDEFIESAIEHMPEAQRPTNFQCETRHVDGKDKAFERKALIEWLKDGTDAVCHILSNARCLSEGIDVPELDGIIFMTPRKSHVDIVQAVGRVMRKVEGKEYGYIVLPVAIPAGTDPTNALNHNERFASVWNVLRALRSHDDRFNAEINKIDLKKNPNLPIIFIGGDDGDDEGEQNLQEWIPFDPVDIPPEAIFAKIVEKCGDREYWESWAEDVADIFNKVVGRIESLLDNSNNDLLRERFDGFHGELQNSINTSITQDDAIDMMAQHILTRPVFEALFENYDFASSNPVSIALDNLRKDFSEFGLEEETRDLERFYESVRMRAHGIDNSAGRQHVLSELYQKFFKKALKKDAERLGIVYTPVEVVDFILHSANEVLQKEFEKSLSDEGVHVLDPFAGAGTFLVRLLQSGLIQDADIERKYREELHSTEIVLLAYYIAAVNIEEAYRGRRGEDSDYEPFNGIVLTDTFNLNKKGEAPTLFPKEWMPGNNTRAEHQQNQKIEVIVGNPPWKAKQRSAADENPGVRYPALRNRIEQTYAEYSTTQNINSLYDTYKMAIRWASDRIKEHGQKQGVVAFVTNGSLIDGPVDAGIRACLAKEFSSIYVLNLRGDQRTQGELSRREGGKVFGQGSRAPVAITILVKNPNATHNGCRILYRDIGDYLSREDKLEKLRESVSILEICDWQEITPDEHYDWIRQRNPAFAKLYPLGLKDEEAGVVNNAIFEVYSQALQTTRDAYIYNFSHEDCAENARLMTEDYLNAVRELEDNPELKVDEVARRHSQNIKWAGNLKDKLKQKKKTEFKEDYIRRVLYRPFVATNCYADYTFIHRKGQMDRIFLDSSRENRVICVPGIGGKKPFSALMVGTMPDLNINEGSTQCFPRYLYPDPLEASDTITELLDIECDPNSIDNISDKALDDFREHYCDNTITKDTIFDYVYGVLHTPSYREEFTNNLAKEMPRIPFALNFHTFAEAGAKLSALHLGYETCVQYPLESLFAHQGEPQPHHFQLTEKAMRLIDNGATLVINEHVRLSSIPEEAHRYVVNGRTPLEWYIDRYKIKRDKDSGILNDPNGWFKDPLELVAAIERIIYVSVESTRIIEGLPTQLTDVSEE